LARISQEVTETIYDGPTVFAHACKMRLPSLRATTRKPSFFDLVQPQRARGRLTHLPNTSVRGLEIMLRSRETRNKKKIETRGYSP
jgi:hypothetical protein